MKRSSKTFSFQIDSINLAEFDMGGVLHHARYFHLYERAREAFLTEIGTPYAKLVKDGYHLAISESSQKFTAPIFFGDKLRLELLITKLSSCGVDFEYFVYKNDVCIHHASTKHAAVKISSEDEIKSGFKVSKIPKQLAQSLEPYLNQDQT